MRVEFLDGGLQPSPVERFDAEAPVLGLRLRDDERSGDVASVARQQIEGLCSCQSRLLGHRPQRLALGQHALAEGEGVARARAERQTAGEDWAVPRPAVEGFLAVAAGDCTAAAADQLRDTRAVEPDAESVSVAHRRAGG